MTRPNEYDGAILYAMCWDSVYLLAGPPTANKECRKDNLNNIADTSLSHIMGLYAAKSVVNHEALAKPIVSFSNLHFLSRETLLTKGIALQRALQSYSQRKTSPQ